MKNKLFAAAILLTSISLYAQDRKPIEYLSQNTLVTLTGSGKTTLSFPMETGEQCLLSAFLNDSEILILTESNARERNIRIFDKVSERPKKTMRCSYDGVGIKGTVTDNYFVGLEYDRAKGKLDIACYDMENERMKIIGELPNEFFSQGKCKHIGDFQVDLQKKLTYINLIDLSDWKKTSPVSFVVYDFGHGKAISGGLGELLFENSGKGGSLFLSKAQGLYMLSPDDFSAEPIELKNIKMMPNQNITLVKQRENAVVVRVTSRKSSIWAKIIDGTGFVLQNEYFSGTFENNCITVGSKIKELQGESPNQITWK